jgi:tRNA threonylcarbamoyl adenosine modification protein YeaZ
MAEIFNMKFTLAIDTATARTQFAILKGEELLWLQSEDGATTHGDVLAKFGAIAAKENIDKVIVGMGPGPFTGLRTGIVFAQSFAFARGLPVHGVCSLDAIAHGIELPEFVVATDARRKELYWARYVDGNRIGDPIVTDPKEIPKLPIFGEGAAKYSLTEDANHLYPNLVSFPTLKHVNEPMYLRHPDAVPTAERK